MYVQIGSYRHALDECGFTTQKTPITHGGFQIGVEETWNITGFLQAATQAALVTALTALEIAYGRNQQTAIILLNDGVTVARRMPGFHPLGGTEIVGGISYPSDGMGNNGAEFTNYRTFNVQIKGRYSLAIPSGQILLSFTESIHFSGGGPRFRFRENLYGRPRVQTLVQQTVYRATQQGSAIGLLSPPTPPAPLWPAYLIEAPETTPHAPKRSGSQGQPTYTEHQLDWSYRFESDVPLVGRPNTWR